MSIMSFLPTIFISLVTLSIVFRYWVFPLLFRQLTQFRVSSFSPLSTRGLEWRSNAQSNSILPTLRVERAGWKWGGLRGEEVGLVILRLDGVSFRLRGKGQDDSTPAEIRPKVIYTINLLDLANTLQRSHRFSAFQGRLLSRLLHLFIHHYPSLARIVSVQVADIRIIFGHLDGLELTVRDFQLGVRVHFEGNAIDTQAQPSESSSPVSPGVEFQRTNPFSPISPSDNHASPGSPTTYFSSFPTSGSLDHSPSKPSRAEARYARLAQARRRASTIHTRMTTTAGQVWSRAIARAHGSVSFSASIRDVAVILPHLNPPQPTSARGSWPDVLAPPLPHANGFKHKPSSRSLKGDTSGPLRIQSFTSTNSFSAFRSKCAVPRYALPYPEGGYEKLLVVEGESRMEFGLGFGPKKGLLGEDTLRARVDVGKLHTSLGASDKLQDLVKAGRRDGTRTNEATANWGPRSMPRVIIAF